MVAKLGRELYVMGRSLAPPNKYNAVNNQWTQRPSLNKEKGSLAAAALHGKLFAIGGGNGYECFSDVEMLDPNIGRWFLLSQ